MVIQPAPSGRSGQLCIGCLAIFLPEGNGYGSRSKPERRKRYSVPRTLILCVGVIAKLVMSTRDLSELLAVAGEVGITGHPVVFRHEGKRKRCGKGQREKLSA